jgi:type II secretory pathway pseudopilin PulG
MRRELKIRIGFTLTEMVVVIGIIVLVVALSLPAFNFITGSRSIESAQNQISAIIGRARANAIGLQKVYGVFFFVDSGTDRVNVAMISESDTTTAGSAAVYLDFDGPRDDVALPPGVSVQLLDDAALVSGARTNDGYIGFNVATGTSLKYGGVILFDGNGHVLSSTYGFRTADSSGAPTQIGALFYGSSATPPAFLDPFGAGNPPPKSTIGFVLFDRQSFVNQGFTLDDVQVTNPAGSTAAYTAAGASGKSEKDEEDWLDQSATALLINRSNGSLIRAE